MNDVVERVTPARKLIRGRTSNSLQVPIAELARIFSIEAGEHNEELSISLIVTCVRSGGEPAGAIVVPQARITWGGDKGGSHVDVDCNARVNIDGCTTLQVDASPSLFSSAAPLNPLTYTFFVTLAAGPCAIPLPNQWSVPPELVQVAGAATPGAIPIWAKQMVIPTSAGTAFPPVGQIIVSMWGSAADYPGGRPIAVYTVESGGTVPIPGGATAYTLELFTAPATIVASPFFQLRI